ncbi:P-loop containing nucleoside triphosphate hydrolase protein [Flammula alnicola]|nr:P-loop containing nucleoside triphosphate hydrolase protein [Flammula alnicola]
MASPHNIIVFGESGAGKSSIVNMLVGSDVAKISSLATGCTFESNPYDFNIEDVLFKIHDTAGLDEGEAGRVPKIEAIVQLWKLLRDLKDGVSLLIFCMRAPRMKDSPKNNWSLFHDILCQKKVPIVIAYHRARRGRGDGRLVGATREQGSLLEL